MSSIKHVNFFTRNILVNLKKLFLLFCVWMYSCMYACIPHICLHACIHVYYVYECLHVMYLCVPCIWMLVCMYLYVPCIWMHVPMCTMYMNVCMHVPMHTKCVPWCLQNLEEGVRSPGNPVGGGCEIPRGCRSENWNLVPLKKQQVLLIAKLNLQPPNWEIFFLKILLLGTVWLR